MRKILILLILAAFNPASAAPDARCNVTAAPHVAIAPVRYVRVKVMIERDQHEREARVELIGLEGLVTASEPRTYVRTQQIEWTNITLPPGDYEVRLMVSDGCTARDTVKAAGSEMGQ